jgi:AcrR family transcriptional regulator
MAKEVKTRKGPGAPSQRTIPQQERSRERVAAILAAASRLLAKYGFDGLNTRQIAAAAKLPPGLLYHYFPNKAAIVMRLAEDTVQPLRHHLARSLNKAKAGAWQGAIRELVSKMTAIYRAEPATAAVLQALLSDPELRRFYQDMDAHWAHMMATFLRVAGAETDSKTLLRAGRIFVLFCDAVTPDLVTASPGEAKRLSAQVSAMAIAYFGTLFREAAPETEVLSKQLIKRVI